MSAILSTIIFMFFTWENGRSNNANDFVERYVALLDLPFSHVKNIKIIVDKMADIYGELRPSSLVATVIYLYAKKEKIKLSVDKICKVCCVSAGNLYKLARKINKNCDIYLFPG